MSKKDNKIKTILNRLMDFKNINKNLKIKKRVIFKKAV